MHKSLRFAYVCAADGCHEPAAGDDLVCDKHKLGVEDRWLERMKLLEKRQQLVRLIFESRFDDKLDELLALAKERGFLV